MQNLERLLNQSDHKPYPAYKALKGRYRFPFFTLSVDHVQGDPFAAPSALSLRIDAAHHGLPKEYYDTPHRRIMLQDLLLRTFYRELGKFSHKAGGSGKSGSFSVSACGQEVMERSALTIDPDKGIMTVRFYAGFPAAGRTTLAMELKRMLMEYVPEAARRSLLCSAIPKETVSARIVLADDQKAIRDQLSEQGLVAFVADGAILPRKSGVNDAPMKDAIPFESPAEDRVTLSLPDNRTITGLGIRRGITLIVGGGYHGKSTLLSAIERGIYNHIPGDGREYVITEDTAMKIRSEDGRSVKQLDISAFIRNLPSGKDTACFSTEDASGSTSQAANTVEAILSGSRTLLIDEDTTATNFMVRDALMQSVIHPDQEPIIPFLSRMRTLYDDLGISTILVAGSSGAFFHVADRVLQMKEYKPLDVTEAAKKAAAEAQDGSRPGTQTGSASSLTPLSFRDSRIPLPNREITESRKVKVRGQGTDSVSLNHESVELRFVEQIVDHEQTNLLGLLLRQLEENYFNGKKPLTACVEELYLKLSSYGFSAIADMSGADDRPTPSNHFESADRSGSAGRSGVSGSPGFGQIPGNLAMIRRQELWAMVNRYRALKLSH